jgi:hypothetical protein
MNVNHAIDSIGSKIIQNDTIITVAGYETKGVKVPYEVKILYFRPIQRNSLIRNTRIRCRKSFQQ